MNDLTKKVVRFSVYPIALGLLWFHFSPIFSQDYCLSLREKFTLLNVTQIIGLLCVFYLMQFVRWFVLLRTYNKEVSFCDATMTYLISTEYKKTDLFKNEVCWLFKLIFI